jgi:hypothetical protein
MGNSFHTGIILPHGNFSLLNFILLAKAGKDSSAFDPSMIYLVVCLVGLFLLVLFLLFSRAKLFPLVKLGLIRLIYGSYSFEFIEFFKEHNIRNPHNNCIKDEISMHFYVFFKQNRNALFFDTETKIDFGVIPFLITYAKLVKQKGDPDCINIAKFSGSRVKLVGYNETLQNMKMRTMFYFINDLFAMGEYHFPDQHRIKREEILAPLTQKYLKSVDVQSDNFYITDQSGNKIHFENNGFSITMKYFFGGDEKINGILNSVFGNTGGKCDAFISAMKQEELLNKL